MLRYRTELLVSLVLVLVTLAGFWHVGQNDFVNFDDPDYVTENVHLRKGLSHEGIDWAFTSTHASNWHPLTWLSLQWDYEQNQLTPRGYHLTNLYLHVANTLLVFLVFRGMTGAIWRSALVATLFGWHPLHVESVAWVAERKDVLSTLFWLLTMAAYAWYVVRPGVISYALVVCYFVLGLLAKPMLVTLPCVLLLLDVWPLQRLRPLPGVIGWRRWQFLLEKIPLLALSVASCAVTVWVQHRGGAVRTLDQWSLKVRVTNATVAYVQYLGKTLWPRDLAVFYPHPQDTLSLFQIVGSALLLVAITLAVLRVWRQQPYWAVGWFWYLGTLVPVIGLVQVGAQAMADRYTYVPLLGIFVALAWGLPELLRRLQIKELILVPAWLLLLVVCLVLSFRQVRHWHDSMTLWEHALKTTENNPVAHNNVGIPLLNQGRSDEAIEHFQLAIALRAGDYAKARNNLGLAYIKQGKLAESEQQYREAVRLDPNLAVAHTNLGLVLSWQDAKNRLEEAIEHHRRAAELQPYNPKVRFNLAHALEQQDQFADAQLAYEEGLRLDPHWPDTAQRVALIFATHKDASFRSWAEAIELAAQASFASHGTNAVALDTLAAAYAEAGSATGQTEFFEKAVHTAQRARDVALAEKNSELVEQIEQRQRCYERREAWRDGGQP